jgi:hypothetical protein
MKARLISSALLIASLSGCASLAEDLAEGLVEAAVEGAFAVALSPFGDDDKKQDHNKHERDYSTASFVATPAPIVTRKGVQQ